ncbi:S-Ena type endospore appendage [Halobacillus sp. K22]|uniref:S-Ena type endospore appendage n=1 Tax=Halobacillus sp. K22 TaxID=3457431 RepID=UPI003FCCC05F
MDKDHSRLQCVNVERVYDWLLVPLHFTTCIEIPKTKRKVSDEICGNFSIASIEQISTLWESHLPFSIAGNVSLTFANGSQKDVEVLVNGKAIETGNREQFNQTFSPLSSVAMINNNPLTTIRGTFCITLHYFL